MFGKKKFQKGYDLGYAQGQLDRSEEVASNWNEFIKTMQNAFDTASGEANRLEVGSRLKLGELKGIPSDHPHHH